jgi:hypothetical protein
MMVNDDLKIDCMTKKMVLNTKIRFREEGVE